MAAAPLAFAPVGVQAAETPAKEEAKSHQEGTPPAAGEIVKLTADSIEIKDHKGITETFIITADTKYGTKEKPARRSEPAKRKTPTCFGQFEAVGVTLGLSPNSNSTFIRW